MKAHQIPFIETGFSGLMCDYLNNKGYNLFDGILAENLYQQSLKKKMRFPLRLEKHYVKLEKTIQYKFSSSITELLEHVSYGTTGHQLCLMTDNFIIKL